MTACTKGKAFAIVSNHPPTSATSNHIPDSQALIFVNKAPQAPPTCFSLNSEPHKIPIPIKRRAAGSDASIA